MNKFLTAALAASVAVSALSTAAFADGKKIGVSWSNFQEERWKTDEAAMKAAIEANGDSYMRVQFKLPYQAETMRSSKATKAIQTPCSCWKV